MRGLLQECGVLLADEKCNWQPSQTVTWLGFTWKFAEATLHASQERVRKLEAALDSLFF